MVLDHMVEYIFSPQAILTNFLGGCLMYALAVDGRAPSTLLWQVFTVEVAAYFLWLIVPGGWAVILSLSLCLYIYEYISGPRLTIRNNAIFLSVYLPTSKGKSDSADEDVLDTLQRGNSLVKVTSSRTRAGTYCLSTDLQYIEHDNSSFWCRCVARDSSGIDIDGISEIHDGVDERATKLTRKHGLVDDSCFHVILGENEKTITFAAKTTEIRNLWLRGLRVLFGRAVDKRYSLWLERVFTEADREKKRELNAEETIELMAAINRPVDRRYIKDIFSVFAEMQGTKDTLTVESFKKFYDVAGKKPEIQQIFDRLNKSEAALSPKKFEEFLKKEQKETCTPREVTQWIKNTEPVCLYNNMSLTGFTTFLMSPEQTIFNRKHTKVYQDMKQPLSHYFIATSHNTYLTKDQLKGKSSVDAYISAFKRGCKCVELDCWDGPNNEPIIYHGHTLTSKILFKDVIAAIGQHAFCRSEYPVILSFENHCSVEQQKVMAKHLTDILGDKLHTRQIPENEKLLPSPHDLRGKILVKARKLKANSSEQADDAVDDDFSDDEDLEEEVNIEQTSETCIELEEKKEENGDAKKRGGSFNRDSFRGTLRTFVKQASNMSIVRTTKKEKPPKIASELSDLVVYCQSVHFRNFSHSKENHQYYEMSSFGEKKAFKLAKEDSKDFVEYNKRQFSRIYPAGARVDSSNYDPQVMWNAGCQLVALNYQTPCKAMQLNQGLFQDNGFCGYVLKPENMRIEDKKFDPRGPFDDGKHQFLLIKIISASQLPNKHENISKADRNLVVSVQVVGVDADCKKEKTKVVKNNGYNPVWNDSIGFKVQVPELAQVHFVVKDGDSFVGQYTLPFRCMMQGYRRIPLRTKESEPLPYAALFTHIDIKIVASTKNGR